MPEFRLQNNSRILNPTGRGRYAVDCFLLTSFTSGAMRTGGGSSQSGATVLTEPRATPTGWSCRGDGGDTAGLCETSSGGGGRDRMREGCMGVRMGGIGGHACLGYWMIARRDVGT